MRARQPDSSGSITRDGVTVGYDVYGVGHSPTVVLTPTWAIAQSQHWKAQVPVLARRYRVITVEGRGNGRADRPRDPAAYTFAELAADVLAVLDATGTERAVVSGVSRGGVIAAVLAATAPERITGAVLIGAALKSLAPAFPEQLAHSFTGELDTDQGWARYNQHYWRRDLRGFGEFFWGEIFPEPHSTKQVEDGVGWIVETDAEVLVATQFNPEPVLGDRERTLELLRSIRCPVLVIHGTDDRITPLVRSEIAAEATGGDLLLIEGGGHCPQARDPIRVNRAITEFVERVTPPQDRAPAHHTWTRAMSRQPRVLYLSSPIGLGHARRDLAIARALRARRPDVRVDWLAQDPVTRFLAGAGERVHAASAFLANESAHLTSEAHEHTLHAFQAIRRMDEILVANFSVFQDVVDEGDYDLVVGDEAWDVDHFWHENPELKRSAYAWVTDFVGWLPMPAGGEREAALTADYNAEMIEHVERFRRVRDRAIFIGEPDDIVPDSFGPGLPAIRAWTQEHYEFTGYVTGFDAGGLTGGADRAAARRRLGYPDDAPVVVVTVGGSGVGETLLRTVVDAYPRARKEIDGLRMLVVCGPRIDGSFLPRHDGVEIRGYVEDLPDHLAACDAAVVQGGLTTTMELVATGRPFVYVPLGEHFEQQRHVRHRLDRHGAGHYLDHAGLDADELATALAGQLRSTVDYLPVPSDGAERAAALLADLL
jgi:pimeloyl-ACP methyl ester carboxylesterase/predicted glycosyltransferase